MPHLILVKQALPEIIPTLTANQWHLSEVGRAQCALLADQLAIYAPSAPVSSSEPKALGTAHLVAHRYAEQNVAVFTRATVLSLYVARATGMELLVLWKHLDLPSLVVLRFPQLKPVRVVEKLTAVQH